MQHITFINAQVITPQGVEARPLSVAGGEITALESRRVVDLSDYLLLPGLVDIHGDGFERHLSARRGAMKDLDQGMVCAEAELAANGITTAVMAQFYSWEGGMRGGEFASRVFSAIGAARSSLATTLVPQLRFEVHLLELYDELPDLVSQWGIPYVVFNDHIPHERLAAGKRPPRLNGMALKSRRSPDTLLALMQRMHGERDEVAARLPALAGALRARGVRLGSHDDQTALQRCRFHEMGVEISEFPETVEAIEAAEELGDATVMGAPNLVRGGSHNGNLSALERVAMGQVGALASDYHYPSMRRAVWLMVDGALHDLAGAWALVSQRPAAILGLTDRGTLEVGKRADLVVLHAGTRRLAATIAGGQITYLSGPIAQRFWGG